MKTSEPIPISRRHLAAIEQQFGTGPFTTAQARSTGLSRQQLHRLIAGGLVANDLRGVYRIGTEQLDLKGRARAAALVLPPAGAVARRTAAWIFGIDCRSPAERDVPMDVECIVPKGRTPARHPSLRCFQTELGPADVIEVEGLACTTPTRTTADLLRWLSPPMGLACADAFAADGFISAEEVLATLKRWPGHRFVQQARRLASWIEPLSESFGESWLRLRLLDAGFPRPTAQIAICDHHGRQVYRLDLGWEEYRLGIEYDGEEFHSGRAALIHDLRRRERLGAQFGWHVVGVGRGEVLGPSMRLENGVGELLGMAPTISRRSW